MINGSASELESVNANEINECWLLISEAIVVKRLNVPYHLSSADYAEDISKSLSDRNPHTHHHLSPQ